MIWRSQGTTAGHLAWLFITGGSILVWNGLPHRITTLKGGLCGAGWWWSTSDSRHLKLCFLQMIRVARLTFIICRPPGVV